MLDTGDLQAIAELIDARAVQTEECFNTRMDEMEGRVNTQMKEMEGRFSTQMKEMEDRLQGLIDTRIRESEDLLLDEMERYDKKNERQFAEVNQRLTTLEGIYRMTKNESDTIALTLQLVHNLDQRVTALEMRAG